MRRYAITGVAIALCASSALAQGVRVLQPLFVTKPDKQFDSVAVRHNEGFLDLAVRLLDDPTFSPDAVLASMISLAGDTTRARRTQRPADARGVVKFGILAAGDYLIEGVRLGSPATSVLVRIRPGCHTYVELYLTYQRFDMDAPTEPRATITTCPDV